MVASLAAVCAPDCAVKAVLDLHSVADGIGATAGMVHVRS